MQLKAYFYATESVFRRDFIYYNLIIIYIMRKTRVRRRFRKRSGTARKTKRNIHKSNKHKKSRRYSRRRAMRGGVGPSDFFHFNPDTVLLGYGTLNGRENFILYSDSATKFYLYNYKNNSIETIDYNIKPAIERFTSDGPTFSYSTRQNYQTDPITPLNLYDEAHYQKIKGLFEKYNIEIIELITKLERITEIQPINIIIKNHNFFRFNLAHEVAHDKNVLFARLDEKTGQFQFIFRDKKRVLFQNRYKLTENIDIGEHDYIVKLKDETIDLFNEAHNEAMKQIK